MLKNVKNFIEVGQPNFYSFLCCFILFDAFFAGINFNINWIFPWLLNLLVLQLVEYLEVLTYHFKFFLLLCNPKICRWKKCVKSWTKLFSRKSTMNCMKLNIKLKLKSLTKLTTKLGKLNKLKKWEVLKMHHS